MKFIKNIFCLLSTLIIICLFFINCKNNLPLEKEPVNDLPIGYGRISLIVSDWLEDTSQRSAFPPKPVFSSYELSFIPKSGQQPMPNEYSSNGKFEDINLAAGNWEITAFGKVIFNGQEECIAEGSKNVFIIANTNNDVEISIQKKTLKNINGLLTWKLHIPNDIAINFWEVTLSDWPNEINHIPLPGTLNNGVIEGSRSCYEGDYYLRVSIRNDKSEVSYLSTVNIRGYETTTYERYVKSDEFVPIINITGSVDLSSTTLDGNSIRVNNKPNEYIKEVRAFSPSGNMIGVSTVDNNNNWSMRAVEPNEEVELEFRVVLIINSVEMELKYDIKKKIFKDDVFLNIRIERNLLKLGGKLTLISVSDQNYSNWELKAYTDDIPSLALHKVNIQTDGSWEMIIEPFNSLTYVHFSVENIINGKRHKRIFLNEKQVSNKSVETSVNLSANFAPPTQVWLHGGNFSNTQYELMQKYDKRFVFTRKKDIISHDRYSFKIIANFSGTVSNPNQSTDSKNYNFNNVINKSVLTLYNNNEAIEWNNNEFPGIYPVENIRIILDFSNDEYLDEKMMPSIKIEKTNEVFIPSGSFKMGSPASEKGRNGSSGKSSETEHTVTLSKPFYMMSTEVDQGLYRSIMGSNPVKDSIKYIFRNDSFPVVNVSWFDAIEFANKLSDRDGLTRAHNITGTGNNRTATINLNASGWRLPTEAEWEYAARAGSTASPSTPFAVFRDENGNILNDGGKLINYKLANYNFENTTDNDYSQKLAGEEYEEYKECITNVDKHYPNNFGLYNIHGNVWEYCWDVFGGDYGTGAKTDPTGHLDSSFNFIGPDTDSEKKVVANQSHRIIRGGSYYTPARFLRSAHRGVITPNDNSYNDIGFRLVRNGNSFPQ